MRFLFFIYLFIGLICNHTFAQTDSINKNAIAILKIKPSDTDSEIKVANTPHYVAYNKEIKQGRLLLFLPGTGGIAETGPIEFFTTAIEQGYRIINLSYINTPAVAQICKGSELIDNPNCAEAFRYKRIYGTRDTSLISDEPQESIINRFTKLLVYLTENDKDGDWGYYLENGSPKWEQIVVSGQSQGGGMAAFIAKREAVARVIIFSGGWDHSSQTKIANWYYNKSITPVERWYGTYHLLEPTAITIDETYRAMNIPNSHIFPLNMEVPQGKKAHSDGVHDPQYKNLWIKLLGIGN